MAFWTIIGTGIEGDAQGRKFGLSLDTEENSWTASGSSVGIFFNTKSGKFAVSALPDSGTQLLDASGQEVAFLRGLLKNSASGSSGSGRASEKGVNFSWTLDSK